MRRRRVRERRSDYEQGSLPSFASTKEEIRRAVERNSIQRGVFLINNLIHLSFESLIQNVAVISQSYDKELWREQATSLQIKLEALDKLDNLFSPIPYPYYFCTPDMLTANPSLIKYYRNVAMISQKVMSGMEMGTLRYELGIDALGEYEASMLSVYFNQIVSEIIIRNNISPGRHVEMVYANVGDSLGGAWRNEIGRLAYVEVVTPLIFHLHQQGYLSYIRYSLKGRFARLEDEEEDAESETITEGQDPVRRSSNRDEGFLEIINVSNLAATIDRLREQRIVYREIGLSNGRSLLLNKQLTWYYQENTQQRQIKIGPDMLSIDDSIGQLWGGELKGGADPAGSDEHWKTATRAFDRIHDACNKTQRPNPKLSFIATILVDRVAREAYQWIQDGKLVSVYNLTQIADNPLKQQEFLNDLTIFLGYE